jgi:CBS-domain-containing membrane protein
VLLEDSIWTMVQRVVGERCALADSSGLINAALDIGRKRFLATETLDPLPQLLLDCNTSYHAQGPSFRHIRVRGGPFRREGRCGTEGSQGVAMAEFAKDIMQTRVITVGIDDPLSSVLRLFFDEEISGAPVVNDRGEVVGVITIRDLLRDERDERDEADANLGYFRDDISVTQETLREGAQSFADRLSRRTANDVMTGMVITVEPDSTIAEVVARVIENRIHRVLVTEPQEAGCGLVGIISLFDLVGLLA